MANTCTLNMLFEVRKNSITKMWTCQFSSIPDAARLKDLERSGHAFYINGKRVTIKKIGEMLNAEN